MITTDKAVSISTKAHLSNAIRALSMDAVQKANSGHPGMPMGMADLAQVLWCDFLNHSPKNPDWANRDRFVLSNGHGSMLLYSLLHLSGYDLSIEDLKNFRQLDSKTPGHPEYGYAPGVETTTGPLGQGIANGVGMAIGERNLATTFNTEDHNLFDHYTYVFCGDGCLMEGVSHEACSLAGTLKLGKLILVWDDNGISIDGKVDAWFSEDVAKRFEAYGWQVIRNIDGHDAEQITKAMQDAKDNTNQPTIICAKTTIGFGSPNKADTAGSHGAPLGDDEIKLTREKLGWEHGPFEIPNDVYQAYNAVSKGEDLYDAWHELLESYKSSNPDKYQQLTRRLNKDLPDNWDEKNKEFFKQLADSPSKLATRKSSQDALKHYVKFMPELFGGSADLTGSNNTNWGSEQALSHKREAGNYCFYGVREFGMAAIMNGLALYGGFIPYGGTFLVFSDYMRNAMRMSALMQQRVIYVLTHDSIGLGEDGPTHQPVEHVSSLRMIPNMTVWRPCDDFESAVAWKCSLENKTGPSSLCLSRQGLAPMQELWDDSKGSREDYVAKGGYILNDTLTEKDPDLILIATGSEVSLAKDIADKLAVDRNLNVRLVSMPSLDLFYLQDKAYQDSVLPKGVRKVAIEAGVSDLWYKLVGHDGLVVGMDQFGESAPASDLFKHFGFTVDKILAILS